MDREYITVAEAARKLGISDRAVRQWIASGKLEAERNGRSWQIPTSAISNGKESEADFHVTAQMRSEIDYLRSELAEKNRQIETQADQIALLQTDMSEQSKRADTIIMQMTQQLDRAHLQLEDLRQCRTLWQRIKGVFVVESG